MQPTAHDPLWRQGLTGAQMLFEIAALVAMTVAAKKTKA